MKDKLNDIADTIVILCKFSDRLDVFGDVLIEENFKTKNKTESVCGVMMKEMAKDIRSILNAIDSVKAEPVK